MRNSIQLALFDPWRLLDSHAEAKKTRNLIWLRVIFYGHHSFWQRLNDKLTPAQWHPTFLDWSSFYNPVDLSEPPPPARSLSISKYPLW